MFKIFLSLFASFVLGMMLFGGLYGLANILKGDPMVVCAVIILVVATATVLIIDKANKESAFQREKKKE